MYHSLILIMNIQVVEITESAGVWSIKSSTTLKTIELKFKVTSEVLVMVYKNFESTDFALIPNVLLVKSKSDQ